MGFCLAWVCVELWLVNLVAYLILHGVRHALIYLPIVIIGDSCFIRCSPYLHIMVLLLTFACLVGVASL